MVCFGGCSGNRHGSRSFTGARVPLLVGEGVCQRLLLIDAQVSPHGHLAAAALPTVGVVEYDSRNHSRAELVSMIRAAHTRNEAPFVSIAIAQHGPDENNVWAWTQDVAVDLDRLRSTMTALTPILEPLCAALDKTCMGKAHIDFLACGVAGACKGLVPALERMYGVDFRASTDVTGSDVNGGLWKMETDSDYDVSADYLDPERLSSYDETMMLRTAQRVGQRDSQRHAEAAERLPAQNFERQFDQQPTGFVVAGCISSPGCGGDATRCPPPPATLADTGESKDEPRREVYQFASAQPARLSTGREDLFREQSNGAQLEVAALPGREVSDV